MVGWFGDEHSGTGTGSYSMSYWVCVLEGKDIPSNNIPGAQKYEPPQKFGMTHIDISTRFLSPYPLCVGICKKGEYPKHFRETRLNFIEMNLRSNRVQNYEIAYFMVKPR